MGLGQGLGLQLTQLVCKDILGISQIHSLCPKLSGNYEPLKGIKNYTR